MTVKSLLVGMATIAPFWVSVWAVAPAQADPPYANCKAAARDGRFNIPRGDPAYGQWLDWDNDGIACERR
jgi:hypothetical protein